MATHAREAIMGAAEHLLRSKGYAAFSYADLAEVGGIRKASIHHHFPTKEYLGTSIDKDYIRKVTENFAQTGASSGRLDDRLEGFRQGFRIGADLGMLPLCGALAAKMAALPASLQLHTNEFFAMQLTWLSKILDAAISAGETPAGIDTSQRAYQLLSVMEGYSFIDWAMQDGRRLEMDVLAQLAPMPLRGNP